MEAREALLTRRSIRRYKPDPISEEDLKEILEAGLSAPSAVNMQHWYFVAVQSPEALDEVKAVMGGVAEKFQSVLEERFSRNPEQIGITNRFLTTLGGAPVCVLAFFLKPVMAPVYAFFLLGERIEENVFAGIVIMLACLALFVLPELVQTHKKDKARRAD